MLKTAFNKIFKSKIYDNKLIQVLKNNERTIIKKYDNYLNNRYYESFQINENNVNYYAKKSMFSKNNVENIDRFHEKTNKSTFIEIEPFKVNNTFSKKSDDHQYFRTTFH